MRGADALRQMRREGYAPNLVIIDMEENWLRSWAEWERLNPTIAKLAPKPGDFRVVKRDESVRVRLAASPMAISSKVRFSMYSMGWCL